jgi:hypothetical protein
VKVHDRCKKIPGGHPLYTEASTNPVHRFSVNEREEKGKAGKAATLAC